MILERDIEKKLVAEVKKRGGKVLKQTGEAGIPDRLVIAPDAVCAFIELKRPGSRPRKLQLQRKKELESLGFQVYVVDSFEGISSVLEKLFIE